jgi:hypothetical protein
MRYLVGTLGLALIVVALVVWLVPVRESVTTVGETSTTKVTEPGAADVKTTEVVKESQTTAPGSARSDAVLSVLLGAGGVLFLVAAFWGRITEIGLPGGGSIKLSEAEVPTIGVDDVAATLPGPDAAPAAQDYARMMTSASQAIVAKTAEIAVSEEANVVVVDLGTGDKWLLPNLFFLALMLERWTCVTLLVFTKTEDDNENLYIACAPPRKLRQALEDARPDLGKARAVIEDASLHAAGQLFFDRLADTTVPGAAPEPPTWVNGELLVKMARDALTLEAVEIESRIELSTDEMRGILAFPHRYVPVTMETRLIAIVDQTRISLRIARFAVRRR